MCDPEVGRAVRELPVPVERPLFFEDLRVRIHEGDRSAARRWRRTSVVLGAVAAAALAAAAAFAASSRGVSVGGGGSVVDRTYACAVTLGTSQHYLDVQGNVKSPAYASVFTASKTVNDQFVSQLSFGAATKGLQIDSSLCHRSSRKVSLTRTGLSQRGTISIDFGEPLENRCATSGQVLMRVRMRVNSAGTPTSAQLAVAQAVGRHRAVAYVEWKPEQISYALTSDCVHVQTSGP